MLDHRTLRGLLLVSLATCGLVLSGCDCDGPGEATIALTSPTNGASLTLADDTNADVPGLQISVTAMVTGLAVDAEIDLLVDEVIATTASVPTDGAIEWNDVTLTSGSHVLVAVAREGGLRSESVTITVNDDCFAVSIITPEPSGSGVTLGGTDDTDGEACGATFETSVVAATAAADGSEARVYVNGTPRRTATVAGGAIRFDGVALDNRGTTANDVRVEVTNADGITCEARFPVPIFVDCEGASCAITRPDTGSAYLNQDDDVSDAAGFQTDFDVTTDASGAGQPVRLILDGDESGALSATPSGMVATFGNVELSEGLHRVRGECTDEAGNVTRSGVAEWTVDITPCAVAIDAPTEGELFTDLDDVDGSTPEIDIDAYGSAGADCSDLRIGACPGIDAIPFAAAMTGWNQRITLGSTAMQDICAQSRDEAGNVATAMVGIRVRTDAPQVEIATPSAGTAYNRSGGSGRTADLNATTSACDALVEVYCSDVGLDVTLRLESDTTPLATAACVADTGVPSPYAGRATFAMAPLPTRENGSSYNLVASQAIDGLVGTSTAVSVTADCSPPALTIGRPTCPATLFPATQDENAGLAGFQYGTSVLFPNGQSGDVVTLTIQGAGGGSVVSTDTLTYTGGTLVFTNADYGAGGMLEVIASATDAAGNLGSSAACMVTVEDIPSVSITAPSAGAALGTANDCAGGTSGLQIQVTATTDAAVGSTAMVTVGSGTPASTTVGAGGAISVCTDAADGRSVMITVAVTDTRGTGSSSVTVDIDTMPPTGAIDPVAATIVDRRGGDVRFSWTAVADAGGLTLDSYELRCASAAITDEAGWTAAAASSITLMVAPGAAGTMQSETVGGFRVGETRHCVLRGVDPVGALTPLPTSSTTVAPAFMEQAVTLSGSAQMGQLIEPIGDVNGDGIDDVLAAGTNAAYLYFGSTSGLPSSPSVTIAGDAAWGFGFPVAGIGDFNGDGRPDFAMSGASFESFSGAVFVFFGRASTNPWPSTINVTATSTPSCTGADVCFMGAGVAAAVGGSFGWDVKPAGDFDGDGVMDLAVGASFHAGGPGRAYVLLGDTSYTTGMALQVPGSGSGPDGFYVDGAAGVSEQMGNVFTSVGGDLTGDSRHDLLIQAAGASAGGPTPSAELYFLPGRAHTAGSGLVSIDRTTVQRFATGTANVFGVSMSGGGDINGDGFLDALVYSPAAGGSVRAYLGAASGFMGATTFNFTNDSASASMDQYGYAITAGRHPWLMRIGDIDGDGVTDVLIGSTENGTGLGTAHLFYRGMGTANVPRSTSQVTFSGASGMTDVDGLRAAFIGDVNGDGFSDIALGDPAFGSGAGRLLIQY